MWIFRSVLVLAAYIGMVVYAGIRVFGFLKFFLPSCKVFIFWPLYLLCSFSYILVFFLRIDRIQPLRRIAMISLPALLYLFLALVILDAARIILRAFNVMPKTPAASAAAAGIALVFTLIMMVYGIFHARSIKEIHYEVIIDKHIGEFGSNGLRVVLVSDLHIGSTVDIKWLGKIVDAVNKTEPDLICLAGDIFDNNVSTLKDPEDISAELRRLNARLGVYACQGNHDIDRLSMRDTPAQDRTQAFLGNAGINYLLDEAELITDDFYLIGRRDSRPAGSARARKSAVDLISDLDKTRPIIVLDHQPLDFAQEEEAGADLILSGHTHRGQIFPGNIATSYIYKKAGAVHYGWWKGRSAQAIVTSGAGVWGPPVRIATNSEVVVVDIKLK